MWFWNCRFGRRMEGSFSIQLLIQVCLLKQVWEFSQVPSYLTVCSIRFLPNQESGIFLGISTHTLEQTTKQKKGFIGSQEHPAYTRNGRYLLQLYCCNGLSAMNILFQDKSVHNTYGADVVHRRSFNKLLHSFVRFVFESV